MALESHPCGHSICLDGGSSCWVFFLPWVLLPMGPPHLPSCAGLESGQWGHPCMPRDDPTLEHLAFAAVAAARNCVQGCGGGTLLQHPLTAVGQQ